MLTLPFTSTETTLEHVGGKGANLARLTRAGFAVPPGFLVTTAAYRAFIEANQLTAVIETALTNLATDDADALENASHHIRAAFTAGALPAPIADAIRAEYATLHQASVAVRSSATAEDLPDLSFAGQQDTYLNILGAEAVLHAVVDCWSSLWTARAIGYRARNHIAHTEAALAVVVQALVPSEVSGVLFTANPLTGLLSETVVDATFGLGEALVSGQVEPDHFVVNSLTGDIVNQMLGAKKISTRGKAGGGVENVEENTAQQTTLTAAQIKELTALGQRIQKEYGTPQDVEWAFANGQLYVLQARAITSLFPVPHIAFDPLTVWISFGAVQGVVGPFTPLGQSEVLQVMLGAGRMFGVTLDLQRDAVFNLAGERVWIKISDVLRHPVGARVVRVALSAAEPSIGQILGQLTRDPRLGAGTGHIKFSTVGRMLRFAAPILANFARNLLDPENARARFDAALERYLSTAHFAPTANRFEALAQVVVFLRESVGNTFAYVMPKFIPMFGPSLMALNVLTHLSGDSTLALTVTRGLPRNVTTEMDLALWETAQAIRATPDADALFRSTAASTLASRYLNHTLPTPAHNALAHFMERYGVRGIGEIDFGQPRWREDPTPVMHTLQSYLNIAPEFAPDAQFAKGEAAAQAALEKIVSHVRGQLGGWVKEKVVRAAARRVRLLMGARESPKFTIIRLMGRAREALLAAGEAFVAAGTLARADDFVFLHLEELEELSKGAEAKDWKAVVAERRATYARELRRRQVPRVLVSDGRAFYEGVGAETDTGETISGSPVSPGVVEGIVHVVFDPRGTHLVPGEILVCPGTDPAWTPLFMAAGGLVMEVGGMMTHGSVVAREYGLPAVAGVHQATTRLKTGQRVRVDGTMGKIVVLGEG